MTSDADEAASLVDDTGDAEVCIGSDNIVSAVGLIGLMLDVLVFLLVGSGESAYIFVELLDDDLIVFKFSEEFCNLRLLSSDTLFLLGVEFGFGNRAELLEHNADFIAATVEDLENILL